MTIDVERLRELATRPASITRSNIAISAKSAEEVRSLAAEVLQLRVEVEKNLAEAA